MAGYYQPAYASALDTGVSSVQSEHAYQLRPTSSSIIPTEKTFSNGRHSQLLIDESERWPRSMSEEWRSKGSSAASPRISDRLLSSRLLSDSPNRERLNSGQLNSDPQSLLSGYGSQYNDHSPSSPEIVLKNGGIELVEPEIKQLLDDLRPFASFPIKDLPHHIGKKLRQFMLYVEILYDCPDYNRLHSWVEERFHDIHSTRPATVGAYMYGCSVRTSFSDKSPGCAASCAGSMPPPKDDEKFSVCKNSVIDAHYSDGHYEFTSLNIGDEVNGENAYLYINSSKRRYVGFSRTEKEQLKALGIKRVKIYGYGPDGRNLIELTTELVSIDQLRSRYHRQGSARRSPEHRRTARGSDDRSSYSSDKEQGDSRKHYQRAHDSGSRAIWVILAVVFFLIIIFLVWYWYRSSGGKQSDSSKQSGSSKRSGSSKQSDSEKQSENRGQSANEEHFDSVGESNNTYSLADDDLVMNNDGRDWTGRVTHEYLSA